MAENWTAIAAEAVAAIGDVGFTVTAHRKAQEAVSPIDAASTVEMAYSVSAVETRGDKNIMVGGAEIIVAKTLMVGAGTYVPAFGDKMTIGSKVLRVQRVMAYAPGGTDLYYKVDLA